MGVRVDVDVLYIPTPEMYFCQVLALVSQASSGCWICFLSSVNVTLEPGSKTPEYFHR